MHKKVHLSSSEWLACWLSLFQCPFHQIFPSQKCSFCFVTVRTRLDFSLKLPSLQLLTSHFQLSFTFGHPGLLMFHFALVNNMQEHHDASQEYIYIFHMFFTLFHMLFTHIFFDVFYTWCTVSLTCRFGVSESLRGVCEDLEHLSRVDTPKAHWPGREQKFWTEV